MNLRSVLLVRGAFGVLFALYLLIAAQAEQLLGRNGYFGFIDGVLGLTAGLSDRFRHGLLRFGELRIHGLGQHGVPRRAKLGLELIGQVLGVHLQPGRLPPSGEPRFDA